MITPSAGIKSSLANQFSPSTAPRAGQPVVVTQHLGLM
jgi:hypothetical protein